MAVNSLKGTTKGTSQSAKYFQNPKNADKKAAKLAYDKLFQKKKKQVKKRVETNKANRQAKTYGKMHKMGMDRSHTADGKLVLEKSSINRGRNGKKGSSLKPTNKKK